MTPITVSESDTWILSRIAPRRKRLQESLSYLARCNTPNNALGGLEEFEAKYDEASGHVDISYAGAHIRFTVVVGLAAAEMVGRVICTHESDEFGKRQSYKLGEFTLDSNGRQTDLIMKDGVYHSLNHSADVIVGYFLAKAFENNLAIEPDLPTTAP